MAGYIPSTKEEQSEMLALIGKKSIDELFASIPESVRVKGKLSLPDGKSELSVRKIMEGLASQNEVFPTIFRGAGAYRHFIPSVVSNLTSRSEFVTAYTPYQAEISQGILQSIFEYQTEICSLTGMDVSNASLYDGAAAAAEAAMMCCDRKLNKILVSETSKPDVLETIKTYAHPHGLEIEIIPQKDGKTDILALSKMLSENVAAIYVEQPNFYGILEDTAEISTLISDKKSKFILGVNPISLGMLKSPGEIGADIAVGEGQPLGLPLAFGGPYLGFIACKEQLARKLPGRIVGETVDREGKRAFVLTLQAREQHIRREKASSSVCSNEALCALTAAVYLAAMGPRGLYEVANACVSKAHYFASELQKIGFERVYNLEFFHEFLTACPKPVEKVMNALEENGILGGLLLKINGKDTLLWCATEMNTKEEIDKAIAIIKGVA